MSNKTKDAVITKVVGTEVFEGDRMGVVCELPSGLIVTVYEMTTAEQELLTNQKFIKNGLAIEKVLEACTKDLSKPLSELLKGDREYLMYKIREISIGDVYSFKVNCTNCSEGNEVDIKLSELKVLKLNCGEDDIFTCVLPRRGHTLKYRLAKGKDELKIVNYRQGKETKDKLISLSLFVRTTEIIDKDGKKVQITPDYFSTLPLKDTYFLIKEMRRVDCGLDTEIIVECDSCESDFTCDMPIDIDFFYP